jgi:hypothetical protein
MAIGSTRGYFSDLFFKDSSWISLYLDGKCGSGYIDGKGNADGFMNGEREYGMQMISEVLWE